jgi:hypothetical protein
MGFLGLLGKSSARSRVLIMGPAPRLLGTGANAVPASSRATE